MPKKTKTVLFLGAGMSAAFGHPVTKDILPIIIQKIKDNTLFNDVTRDKGISSLYRTLLKNLLIALSPGINYIFRKEIDVDEHKDRLPLVTEFLSQLEHLISANHNIVDWNFDVKHN